MRESLKARLLQETGEKVSLKAINHIASKDERMARVVKACKENPALKNQGKPFESLCRSIVHQQLATKAAATIHSRFKALYGGKDPKPEQILDTPDEKMRACGLSRQKTSYLKDLSQKVMDGTVEIHELDHLTDEEIIKELTSVKGIGVWTAQMFLMFNLGRLDVFPVKDLGIRNGMQKLYKLRTVSDEKLEKIADKWRPYRSVGSWYVWRYKDGETGAAG